MASSTSSTAACSARWGPPTCAAFKTFHRDYPEAAPLLLYRGSETLERDGVRCMPVDRFLRELVPGRALPR